MHELYVRKKCKQKTSFASNCARNRHTHPQSKEKLEKTKCQPHFKEEMPKRKRRKRRTSFSSEFSIYFWRVHSVYFLDTVFFSTSTFRCETGTHIIIQCTTCWQFKLRIRIDKLFFLCILIFLFSFVYLLNFFLSLLPCQYIEAEEKKTTHEQQSFVRSFVFLFSISINILCIH